MVDGMFSANDFGEYKRSHTLTIPSITFTSSIIGGSVTSSNQQLWYLEVAVASAANVVNIYEDTRVMANLQTGKYFLFQIFIAISYICFKFQCYYLSTSKRAVLFYPSKIAKLQK